MVFRGPKRMNHDCCGHVPATKQKMGSVFLTCSKMLLFVKIVFVLGNATQNNQQEEDDHVYSL